VEGARRNVEAVLWPDLQLWFAMYSRCFPANAGTTVSAFGQQLYAVPIKSADDPVPHVTAYVAVAALFSKVNDAADLKAVNGPRGHPSRRGELGDGDLGEGSCCGKLAAVEGTHHALPVGGT
jgi:hypothetical protein